MADRTASQELHAALLAKGYRVLAQHAARTNRQHVFTLYGNASHVLIMQTRGTDLCELYRPVSESNSVAETIAAIP